MGMFNDYRNTGRDQWRFPYDASTLLPYMERKLAFWTRRENLLRDIISKRVANPAIPVKGDKNEKLQKALVFAATEREKCLVWVHEFQRRPEAEYQLALGDVTYLDIAGLPASPDEDDLASEE